MLTWATRQVYFHKTRVAYDIHLREALREILPDAHFPSPVGDHLREYLGWDDWRVLGLLADGKGGNHGRRLVTRDHFRLAFETPEVSDDHDFSLVENVKAALGELLVAEAEASKSWYKTGKPDIPVISNIDESSVLPLSKYSHVVANIAANNQVLLYVTAENSGRANAIVKEVAENERNKQGTFGFDTGAR